MSKKARRKPSAKQLAWRKKFISRFVRGGTKKRRKQRSSVSSVAQSPSPGVSQMAKTKRRRRGYSGSRRSRRRSGGGGGGGFRGGRGFIPTDAVSLLGGGVVGAIGSELVLSKIPLDFVKSGYGRILAKFVVGTAAWYLLRRMAPKIGLGIFAGAGIGAARDVAALLLSGGGSGGGAATGIKGLVSPGAPYALPQGGGGGQVYMNQATGQYYRAG